MAVLPGTHGAISARAHTGSAAATPALSGEAALLQLPIIGQSLAVLRELLQQPALHAKLLPESRQILLDHRGVLMTLLPGLGASGTTLHRMGVPKASDHAGATPMAGAGADPASGLLPVPIACGIKLSFNIRPGGQHIQQLGRAHAGKPRMQESAHRQLRGAAAVRPG